ncbi:hypothetical protein ACLB2K_046179 [Fragaria x ananassa]
MRTKRIFDTIAQSSIGSSVPASDDSHPSKISKSAARRPSELAATKSAEERRPSRLASARRRRSNLMNIKIDDLPETVLIEILCRLPSYKFVAQCKCVSKRWCSLMSDPCFIRCFLSVQRDRKQTPIVRTLINNQGKEFLGRMPSSSTKLLTQRLERLKSAFGFFKEPVVLGTYNDLVLCCPGRSHNRDYFICNPHTGHWVHLPPPPQRCDYVAVGFICDLPYYNCKADDQKGAAGIQINAEYRCRVVRILFPGFPRRECSSEYKVQIYSSEDRNWEEHVVSFPSPFRSDAIEMDTCYTHNQMLYWKSWKDNCFLIAVDPFMFGSSRIIDHYKGRLIKIELPRLCRLKTLGVHRGRLQAYAMKDGQRTLYSRAVNDEETNGGVGKVCFEKMMTEYSLETDLVPADHEVRTLGFDPDNMDMLYMLYLRIDEKGTIVMYDISTRKWSRVVENTEMSTREWLRNSSFFPLVLPWWPTPVSKLGKFAYLPKYERWVKRPKIYGRQWPI